MQTLPTIQPPESIINLFPKEDRHRYQKLARRVFTRTGIPLPWPIVPILERLYNKILEMPEQRGLSAPEMQNLFSLPPHVLENMVAKGVLAHQTGFEWNSVKGEACDPGTPVTLYRLSSRLEAILGWRFRKQDT
jgi:hypothetical protein